MKECFKVTIESYDGDGDLEASVTDVTIETDTIEKDLGFCIGRALAAYAATTEIDREMVAEFVGRFVRHTQREERDGR